MIRYFLVAVIGYLIGSISNGILIARIFGHMDIRTKGSGNTGATNTLRVMGPKFGALTFILDFLKGMVCAWLGQQICGDFLGGAVCGFTSVLGHNYPIFFGFRGGKGISTSFGANMFLFPVQASLSFVIFFILVLVTRYVSVGSIAAAVALPLLVIPVYCKTSVPACVFALLFGALAIYRHRANIVRLIQHKENKFSFKKK